MPKRVNQVAFTCSPGVFSLVFFLPGSTKDFASPPCPVYHVIPYQGICHTENLKQIFPEMTLRGLVSKSYIHVSVSNLYIPTIGLPILIQENVLPDCGHTDT
jgi:hypothetical protein